MRGMKRFIAFSLILAAVFAFSGLNELAVYAAQEQGLLNYRNEFISLTVDKSTGRFGISTVEGAPARNKDQNSPLLFTGEKPESSFTTFRIEGEDYIFGNDYGFLSSGGGVTQAPTPIGDGIQTIWRKGDIEVSQLLTLPADPASTDIGNVKVAYSVTNRGEKNINVGSRILFDTKLGSNDGAPLMLPGMDKPLEYEISLEGDKVPNFWQAADNDAGPEVISFGLVNGWGNVKPDRFVAAHWQGISDAKWDYQTDSTLKFTSPYNPYNINDSAVALYWNPEALMPGETRVYETYYGLGVFGSANGSTFLANLECPDSLQLNESKTAYGQEEFNLTLSISNKLPVSSALENVSATIELDGGVLLTGDQTKTRQTARIEMNSDAVFRWTLKASPADIYRLAQATIYLKSDSLKEPVVYNKFILLPGTGGQLPNIQYTGVTPPRLYAKDNRKSFNINGSGFEMLRDRSRWTLKLSRGGSNPAVYAVDHNNIHIVEDTTLNIVMPDIQVKGMYSVTIESDSLTGCRMDNCLELTDDAAFKNLSYGILAVTGSDKEYNLTALENETALKNFPRPDEILMVIRGDVRDKGNGLFEVFANADGVPAEINEVLQYESVKPLIAKGDSGTVTISGNGDLSLKGSIDFWKWDFEIRLDREKTYSLKQSGENPGEKVQIQLTGAAGALMNMLSGFNIQFNNAYLYKDTDGYGVIFGGSMSLSIGGGNDKKDDTFNKDSGDGNKDDSFNKDDGNNNDNNNNNNDNSSNNNNSNNNNNNSNNNDNNSNSNNNNNNNNDTITNNDNTISGGNEGDGGGAFKIEANVDKVAMGQKKNDKTGATEIGLRGISVNTRVGFPKDYFPPPVDIGAEAGFRVDTFAEPAEIGFDVDIDLKVIEVQGELEFMLYQNKYPIPNTLGLYVGSEIGVKIIPPIPVATLNGVGGKIENLYSLVDWDRMYSAPLTVSITATATICEILKMDHVTMSINWQQVQIKGDIGIKGYDIIKDATMRLRWYNPFSFELSARLEAFECIEGGVMLRITKDDFLGTAYARLFIPEDIDLIGGLELLSAELGVSDEMIWGEVKIIGIGAGIKYVYGESVPDFYLASLNSGMQQGLLAVDCTDEKTGGKAIAVYGTNMRLVGSSSSHSYALRDAGALALAGDIPLPVQKAPVVYALGANSYALNISDGEAALFELEYEGAKPSIKAFRPDGTEYPLVEDNSGNLRFQTISAESSKSGKTEQKLWISVINPEAGTWKIVSDKPLISANLFDVKMSPELTSLAGTKLDPQRIRLDWTGKYLNGAQVNLVLAEKGSTAAGRLLAENMDAAAGTCIVTIPDDVPGGDYDIRAEISKEDYGYSTRTTGSFAITDLKAPPAPQALAVEPAGNGMFRVSWAEGTGSSFRPDGYMLNVLNEDGKAVEGFPEAYVQGRTETILGGEAPLQDGAVIRLEPGKKYSVSVMAHYEEEPGQGEVIQKQHFSVPVISQPVLLPVPNPPRLNVLVKRGEEPVPVSTSAEEPDTFLAAGTEVTLILNAGEIISAEVLVNDETAYSRSGSSSYEFDMSLREGENKVIIKSYNASGDRTVKIVTIRADTKPPLLFIESAAIRAAGGKAYAELRGKSEQGCILTINGASVYLDENGNFEHTLPMGDAMHAIFRVVAQDSFGNKTNYETTVYNNTLKAIQNVQISVGKTRVETGDKLNLTLYAFDGEGGRMAVDPALVGYSLMTDDKTISLEAKGAVEALKPGKAYILAEYQVTEGYSHTDAIVLDVYEKSDGSDRTAEFPKRTGPAGPAEVLEYVRQMNRGFTELYAGRLQPGAEANIDADGILKLNIPAGALSSADDLIIRKVSDAGGLMDKFPGMKLLSPVYDIRLANGSRLNAPVTVSFQYGGATGADNRRIAVYRLDDQRGNWVYIGGNTGANEVITVRLSGFSKYAVIENANLMLFSDVPADRWSRDAIGSLAYRNIVNGVNISGIAYFLPENNITRAEFIKMLTAAIGLDKQELRDVQLPFRDSASIPDWAAPYMKASWKFGLVNGRADKDGLWADADKNITREEACAILGRTFGDKKPERFYFNDRGSIAEYARKYADLLMDMGIVTGYQDHTFRPKNLLTREEAAAIIDRYVRLKD